MVIQAWPFGTGTMQQGCITLAFMAPQGRHFPHHHAGNSSLWLLSPEFVLSFSFSPGCYAPSTRASVIFLLSITNISGLSSVNSSPLELSLAMPRERGKVQAWVDLLQSSRQASTHMTDLSLSHSRK
jgi:hypothetical protein